MPSHTKAERKKKKIRAGIVSRIKKFFKGRESFFTKMVREEKERIARSNKRKAQHASRMRRRPAKKEGRGR